jgi:hypothetical protein
VVMMMTVMVTVMESRAHHWVGPCT